jgi:ATP-binding cassette subfamily F protein uup
VSHDRAFLDNVVTQTLVAEGEGRWKEYVGGYSDWLQQRPAAAPAAGPAAAVSAKPAARTTAPAKKLGFREQRELEQLPGELEALEKEQADLALRMSSPEYHRQGPAQLKADRERAAAIEALLAEKFERWAELDRRAAPVAG